MIKLYNKFNNRLKTNLIINIDKSHSNNFTYSLQTAVFPILFYAFFIHTLLFYAISGAVNSTKKNIKHIIQAHMMQEINFFSL